MKMLSRKEELLLLAIWKLQENAYGVPIREHVSSQTRKYWSIGAVYDVLDRLTRKGYVATIIGEPTCERGGKSKRFYSITQAGYAALEDVRKIQDTMWSDLPRPVTD